MSSCVSLVHSVHFSHLLLVALAMLMRLFAVHLILPQLGMVTTTTLNWRQQGDKIRQLRILHRRLVEAVDEINNGFAFVGLSAAFVVLISATFANYEATIDAGDWWTASSFALINVLSCRFCNAFLIDIVSITVELRNKWAHCNLNYEQSSAASSSFSFLGREERKVQSMSEMVFCRYNY